MKRIYTAALIGAGNIAANYDEPGDEMFLTHAHAMTACSRLNCLGFYDSDSAAASKAAQKWHLGTFSSLEELTSRGVDIIVVCVPDNKHGEVLRALLNNPPRLVLCEKPVTTNYSESAAIIEEYARRGIPLAVNYQRRYDSVVCELKRKIQNDDLGAFLAGTVLYSKGINHNGSHAVDLLRHFFGEAVGLLATARVNDYSEHDPTTSGTIFFECGQVQLIAGDERLFSLFEIDLVFEKARYRFIQSGLAVERYAVRDDPIFNGYRELSFIAKEATGLSHALPSMVDDLVSYLDGGADLRISSRNALDTQRVCEKFAAAPLNHFVYLEPTA